VTLGRGVGLPPACAGGVSSWVGAQGRPLWGLETRGDPGDLRGRDQDPDCGRGRDLARVHCHCSSGIPRMTAGRWEESLAAVFPRMSSILEAGDLPEDLGQDIPASGLGILRSSLGCLCSRRWVDRELCSSRVEVHDPDILVEDPVQEVQEVQEVQGGLLGMRGREELQGGRA